MEHRDYPVNITEHDFLSIEADTYARYVFSLNASLSAKRFYEIHSKGYLSVLQVLPKEAKVTIEYVLLANHILVRRSCTNVTIQ